MKAAFSISIDNQSIDFGQRFMSLSLIDKRGMEADELTLTVDDSDGALQLPKPGRILTVALGWQIGDATQLVDKGQFKVDEITQTGPPDVITIRARSADVSNALTSQKERSWHQKTLGDIVRAIAQEQSLIPVISPVLAQKDTAHIDQTNESDANLLTRLAQRYNAFASVKSGRLLFIARNKAQTVSGQGMPTLLIQRGQGDTHTFTMATRSEKVSGVKAFYHDKVGAKKIYVLAGKKGTMKQIKTGYATKQLALEAAHAKLKHFHGDAKKLQLNLAQGVAQLGAETAVTVTGFKQIIDQIPWVVHEVTHTLNSSGGYTNNLSLEPLES